MKKIISLMLALVMCMTLYVPALAKETQLESSNQAVSMIQQSLGETLLQDELIQNVENDLAILTDVGFSPELVSIEDISDSGKITYNLALTESLNSLICVEKDAAGTIVLDITEEERYNNLEIYSDGTMILDGQEVIITIGENALDAVASPRVIRNVVYQSSPFGTMRETEFTNYLRRDLCPDVDARQTIINMTVGALVAVMGGAVGAIISAALGTTVTVGMINTAVGGGLSVAAVSIQTFAKKNEPDTAHFSFMMEVYEHYRQSTPIDRYSKYILDYYPMKNYGGDRIQPAIILYERNYII